MGFNKPSFQHEYDLLALLNLVLVAEREVVLCSFSSLLKWGLIGLFFGGYVKET